MFVRILCSEMNMESCLVLHRTENNTRSSTTEKVKVGGKERVKTSILKNNEKPILPLGKFDGIFSFSADWPSVSTLPGFFC